MLDRLQMGVMMLDARGPVLMTNAKARGIIADADDLMVGLDDVFRAADGEETRALLELVRSTIAGTIAEDASCALTISRPLMRQALNILVTPLSGRRRQSESNGAAIFISDPEQGIALDEDVLHPGRGAPRPRHRPRVAGRRTGGRHQGLASHRAITVRPEGAYH